MGRRQRRQAVRRRAGSRWDARLCMTRQGCSWSAVGTYTPAKATAGGVCECHLSATALETSHDVQGRHRVPTRNKTHSSEPTSNDGLGEEDWMADNIGRSAAPIRRRDLGHRPGRCHRPGMVVQLAARPPHDEEVSSLRIRHMATCASGILASPRHTQYSRSVWHSGTETKYCSAVEGSATVHLTARKCSPNNMRGLQFPDVR